MPDARFPLPRGCARVANAALLAAEALHRAALSRVRAGFERALDPRARLVLEVDRLRELVAVRDEELRILKSRLVALQPRQRPHYAPEARFAILSLRSRTGWNAAETARRFLVTPTTIAGWARRVDDKGKDALVRPRAPVNRHPDRVARIVQKLHALAPQVGKRKAADLLARAGLKLAASTVARLRKRQLPPPPPSTEPAKKRERAKETPVRAVAAKHPHHLWHVDITTIATGGGIALPFWPFALPMLWPFAWQVAVVVDHFSRALVAFEVFTKEPRGQDICRLLDRAKALAGTAPRHVVTDQGMQFGVDYLAWCTRNDAKPRFGAIGKHDSIAIVERFIRSLKEEHLRRILVPFSRKALAVQIAAYQGWYNNHRPHMALGGNTPVERATGQKASLPRLEPRPLSPLQGDDRVRRCGDIELSVAAFAGHAHLPVIDLRASA